MYGPHPDDLAPLATMDDAHREWHRNAGVPMGQPGCPQDACHLPDPECWECCDVDSDNCPACIEALRESEVWLSRNQGVDWRGPQPAPHPEPPF